MAKRGIPMGTTEEWIAKARKVHGDHYDYSVTEYNGSTVKVNIICPAHGLFQQQAGNHIYGKHGCKYCGKEINTEQQFFSQCKEKHGERYDYSLVNYVNMIKKIVIVCREHGSFMQTPTSHLSAEHGCRICFTKSLLKKQEEWIVECKAIHNGFYDYSLVEYTGRKNNLQIICPVHGMFEQKAGAHLRGYGCHKC